MTSEFDLETYNYFLDEAQDLLKAIEQDLLSLKEDPSPNKVNNMMRSAHTLKGAAASVGLDTIKEISHVLEDVFKTLYNPDLVVDDEIESLLFQGYECLRLPLTAYVSGSDRVDESSMLNRAANVITQLQEKLGDRFDSNPPLPTSTDLGFDVVQSIFETGVEEKLTAIENASASEIGAVLHQKAEVFLGLGESLDLPGYSEIAEAILNALDRSNEDPATIAKIALADLRAGQKLVLEGDRDRGGSPSSKLLQLAGQADTEYFTAELILPTEDIDPEEVSIDVVETNDVEVEPEAFGAIGLNSLFADTTIETQIEDESQEDSKPSSVEIADIVEDIENTFIQQDNIDACNGDNELTPSTVDSVIDNSVVNTTVHDRVDARSSNVDLEISLDRLLADTTIDTQVDAPSSSAESQSNGEPLSLNSLPDRTNVPKITASEPKQRRSLSTSTVEQSTFSTKSTQKSSNNKNTARNKPKKDRKFASVRVELEQLERLNHLVGELSIDQNQQTNQDKQLRTVVQKLLQQLQQHQQTLNELRDWSDRKWLNNKIFSDSNIYEKTDSSLENMFDPLEMDRYNDLQVLIQKAVDETIKLENHTELIYQFGKQATKSRETQQRLLTHVRDDLTTARMQPLGDLFNRFPRLLEQLASVHNKQAKLALIGSDVLVDKAIVEKLYDPLLHLIRNAFDHGIDPAEVRKAHNKPEVGTIEIRAYHLGNRTIIEVKDDGQGINFTKIAQKAVEAGFITPEQQNDISKSELLEFLFKSGFSTANELTDLSGRGVGLDVVRSQIETLNGSVTVNSIPNSGTTFTLEIPLSLTIAKLLVCQANEVAYAIPVNTIEQILIPGTDRFRIVGKNSNNSARSHSGQNSDLDDTGISQQLVLHWQQNNKEILVPVYKLSELTQYSSLSSRFVHQNKNKNLMETEGLLIDHSPVVLLRTSEGLIGLQIEQLLGEKELVIRTLGAAVDPPAYLYGCCILSNTSLALVIDAEKLIQHQQKTTTAYPHSKSNNNVLLLPPSINNSIKTIEVRATSSNSNRGNLLLVVDDSLTLRQTLTKALKKFGYQVIQAENGKEGLGILQQNQNIDLVICDIEMPHLNGLELLNIVNQNKNLSIAPIVMLTSRSGDKYRQIAKELGASAYLTKPFIEKELFSTIKKLLPSPTF